MTPPNDNEWLIDEAGPDTSTPTYALDDDEVEATDWDYPDRAEGDWVVSGPLGSEGYGRPGRWFASWKAAERWAREKYGDRFKRRIPETSQYGARWGFLIAKMGD